MLGRKIKLYRLQQELSKKELEAKTGIKTSMLTAYEEGKETPDTKTVRLIADVLGVPFSDFMKFVPSSRKYQHEEFKKQSSLSRAAQSYLRLIVEEYFVMALHSSVSFFFSISLNFCLNSVSTASPYFSKCS